MHDRAPRFIPVSLSGHVVIHGVDGTHDFEQALHLARLPVADEAYFDAVERMKRLCLGADLLGVVLAEEALARGVGGAYGVGIEGLGDGHEADAAGSTPRGALGAVDRELGVRRSQLECSGSGAVPGDRTRRP